MTADRGSAGSDVRTPGFDIEADLTMFVEQARWLVELHNARADGVQQRAMSLLGLVGVMLTLLLTGITSDRVTATVPVKVAACVSALDLLAAAWFLFKALQLQTVTTPPVGDFHGNWFDYCQGSVSGVRARGGIVNSFLGGDPTTSPVLAAMQDVDGRAGNLRRGLWVLLAGFALLAALIIFVTVRLGRGRTLMTEDQSVAPAPTPVVAPSPVVPAQVPSNPLADLPQPNFDVVSKAEHLTNIETRSQ